MAHRQVPELPFLDASTWRGRVNCQPGTRFRHSSFALQRGRPESALTRCVSRVFLVCAVVDFIVFCRSVAISWIVMTSYCRDPASAGEGSGGMRHTAAHPAIGHGAARVDLCLRHRFCGHRPPLLGTLSTSLECSLLPRRYDSMSSGCGILNDVSRACDDSCI